MKALNSSMFAPQAFVKMDWSAFRSAMFPLPMQYGAP